MTSCMDHFSGAGLKVHCASDEDSDEELVEFQTEEAILAAIGDEEDAFVEEVVEFGMSYAGTVRDDHALFVGAQRSPAVACVGAKSCAPCACQFDAKPAGAFSIVVHADGCLERLPLHAVLEVDGLHVQSQLVARPAVADVRCRRSSARTRFHAGERPRVDGTATRQHQQGENQPATANRASAPRGQGGGGRLHVLLLDSKAPRWKPRRSVEAACR